MMVRMRVIALFHLKTSLTFFSLPVLFLFAHAAGMVGLRVVAFWLWQPQAHSEWCSGRIKNWTEEWNSPWTPVSPVKLSNFCGFLPDQPSLTAPEIICAHCGQVTGCREQGSDWLIRPNDVSIKRTTRWLAVLRRASPLVSWRGKPGFLDLNCREQFPKVQASKLWQQTTLLGRGGSKLNMMPLV